MTEDIKNCDPYRAHPGRDLDPAGPAPGHPYTAAGQYVRRRLPGQCLPHRGRPHRRPPGRPGRRRLYARLCLARRDAALFFPLSFP